MTSENGPTRLCPLVTPAAAANNPPYHHSKQDDDIDSPVAVPPTTGNNFLVTSPYTTSAHLLDLSRLDKPSQLLARALAILQPVRDDYATAPYVDSFNWPAVLELLQALSCAEAYSWTERRFYVILFRSRLKSTADRDYLHELDAESHREAVDSGGLLKYWFGSANANRENLATCIWRSRQDARVGGTGPWHRRARNAIEGLYEEINLTTLELVIGDAVEGWRMAEWSED
ncbi:hypothetical protein FE257_010129 [Aspergillus nanangensis]|uniref:Uncharacterized protein n=1 Tax=Aspergillus nanangensis TaxID=2582783 RepID=A0AAD4CJG2_ASPNN|nr:hypothetical protein FE257_010129 [Aspergillus nanangensis]